VKAEGKPVFRRYFTNKRVKRNALVGLALSGLGIAALFAPEDPGLEVLSLLPDILLLGGGLHLLLGVFAPLTMSLYARFDPHPKNEGSKLLLHIFEIEEWANSNPLYFSNKAERPEPETKGGTEPKVGKKG